MKYFIIFFSIVLNNLYAQNPQWVVYDTTNSLLPSNYVRCVTEDRDKNIWVGTSKGLVKISAEGWTIYTKLNSGLPSNRIEAIAVDSNNVKWIGLGDFGLVKYNDTTWESFTSQNSILPSDWITQIIVDKYNRVWIASMSGYGIGGVLMIKDTVWVSYTEENSGLQIGTVTSIDLDNSDNVWIAMEYLIVEPLVERDILGGLTKFDGANWELFNYNTPGLTWGSIYFVEADGDTIWVATDWGLSRFNGTEWITYLQENSGLPDNHVNVILVDRNNVKWLGIGRANFDRKGALVKYDGEAFTLFDTINSPISPGWVTSIFIDSRNYKWIGISPYWDQATTTAYGGGLAVYNENGVILGLDDKGQIESSSGFQLDNNYPNPFNPSTRISFTLPEKADILLKVYSVIGELMNTVVKKTFPAGHQSLNFDGTSLPSGVYIYRIEAKGISRTYIASKKMLLLK